MLSVRDEHDPALYVREGPTESKKGGEERMAAGGIG